MRILEKLAELNDQIVAELLPAQLQRTGDLWDGGLENDVQIPNVHSTNAFLLRVGTAFACKASKFHRSDEILPPLERAAECLLRVQHEDGTIDLYSTNFHSTPDTAFIVNFMSPVFVLLKRIALPQLERVLEKLELFLRNAGECLAIGGIHTPNHRWIISSALARINSFFPDERFVDRIDRWLAEGIDQDPDGQFTEHSVGIYSPFCDQMFLTMGRLLPRDALFDAVRRNLDMTLYYIQPTGEVLTNASNRQDNNQIATVSRYYYPYRYFAVRDQNPTYAAVCELIENRMPEQISWDLAKLLEDPLFEQDMPIAGSIPTDYSKQFPYSGVTRIRRANTDVSIIESNPTFLVMRKGRAVLHSLRLGASFFGSRGQFVAQSCTGNHEKFILRKSMSHGYYQPYPQSSLSGDGVWEQMPVADREMSELQTMEYAVEVSESGGSVSIEIAIEGTPRVPVSIELSFREGGVLEGVIENHRQTDTYFLETGFGRYKVGEDSITFGPGKMDHQWSAVRGMPAKHPGKSVYLTGYTPFRHVLTLS